MERRLFMHNRWQLLVVMALALASYGGDNYSATELSAAQEVSTTTTIQPTTTEPTPTTTTTTNSPGEREPAQPGSGRGETTPTGQEKTYKVVEGDTLWTIAKDHLTKATGTGSGKPTDQEVTEYFTRVKEANQSRLQSGDPDLIYPGEEITLPPVSSAPAEPAPETRVQASHVVVEGDNLWTIARDHLAEARSGGAGELTTREVAAYWLRVVEANARNVRSGDPDLIYPGETIVLPPVD
jgi:nucleoid-associated protein YgaU